MGPKGPMGPMGPWGPRGPWGPWPHGAHGPIGPKPARGGRPAGPPTQVVGTWSTKPMPLTGHSHMDTWQCPKKALLETIAIITGPKNSFAGPICIPDRPREATWAHGAPWAQRAPWAYRAFNRARQTISSSTRFFRTLPYVLHLCIITSIPGCCLEA